jgi:hypothetical protein
MLGQLHRCLQEHTLFDEQVAFPAPALEIEEAAA